MIMNGWSEMAVRMGSPRRNMAVSTDRLWSLPAALSHLTDFVADRAGQAGKSAVLEVDCPPMLVRREIVEAAVPALVQLLRNAIEHGIEAPMDRLVAGKSLTAIVTIQVTADPAQISFTVHDDGVGIEPARIAAAAVEAGVLAAEAVSTMADEAKLALAFRRGVTLGRERGHRGVGLERAALRLRPVNGRVGMMSKPGKGSRFFVVVPTAGELADGAAAGGGLSTSPSGR
jgi:two-component system chemotaxis sensor kinase CheA